MSLSPSLQIDPRLKSGVSGSHYLTMHLSNPDVISFNAYNVNAYIFIHKQEFSERLSQDEEKALNDIKAGKTKMVNQSGEEFLKELHEMIDEE